MTELVFVLNAGSSSLKYQVLDPESAAVLARGTAERVGTAQGRVRHTGRDGEVVREASLPDHGAALRVAADLFAEDGMPLDGLDLVAVGHRVVHGGRRFREPHVVDDDVLASIRALGTLAPLHNPANADGIARAREVFPDVPHVAVFDTAFFADLPEAASTYAIDRELALTHHVRRYGFHGTSHKYVAERVPHVLGVGPSGLRQVVLHLGNGASASAVRGGRALDTSMGLTPLEGLVMGTRGGDVDPGVLLHLSRRAGLDVDAIDRLLNTASGLKGLTGSGDMRDVQGRVRQGDSVAALAVEVYLHRIRKYVGAYAAVLGGLDALTFTAGVGENDADVRARAVEGLDFLGLAVDPVRNEAAEPVERVVSPEGAGAAVLVVPTNEELEIARQARALL